MHRRYTYKHYKTSYIPVPSGSSWKSEKSLGLPAALYLRRALLITVCVWSRLLNCQQQQKMAFSFSHAYNAKQFQHLNTEI